MDKQNITLRANGKALELKNPILTASGTFGYGTEFAPYGDLKTLGGMILKGISLLPREGNTMPRIAETPSGMLNAVGLQNCGVEAFLRVKLDPLPWQETPVIANLYAESPADFAALAEKLAADARIAALEVNISCPNVATGGSQFGQDPAAAAAVTAAVVKVAGPKPVIVKLTPNVGDITEIAKACEGAGADMLSCINTVAGVAVDLASRRLLPARVPAGLSGPAIKPVGLRCVWQVSRAVAIPIIGVGGIMTVEDVLEYILVGAHAVQVGTASFVRPDAAFALAAELPAARAKYGVASWDDLRGKAEARQ